MEDGIPKKIGRYTVDRLLGSGAMGFVFLGRDPELDRAVAIKTVRDLKMDPEALALFLERFRNEARAAARLHHPNIVQVYDVGEEPEVGPYLVFEYVAGSTLKNVLKSRGALEPVQVVRLAEEVGEALTLAHDSEIIHRDIKPDNLLVTPDGQTKLADFGIARMPNASLTREGQFLGTPCYAAPETLAGAQYGPQSDLFSFAAVMYEAASGARAFPGTDAVAVAHKVIHEEPVPVRQAAADPSRIPEQVEAVIMAGLSKDPSRRHESAAEFAAAIREAYEEAGLVEPADLVRPPSRRIPLAAQPTSDPGRGGWAFGAVVGAGLAVGLAIVFSNGAPAAVPPLDASIDALGAEDAAEADAGTDAGEEPDAGEVRDAAPDLGVPDVGVLPEEPVPLDPFAREEAAKDALDQARAALADGDAEAARRALDEARRFDPENPDIEELDRAVAALESE